MARPRPVLLAWSGGKDSAMALARLGQHPDWQVIGLLTTIARARERVSIHGYRCAILRAQGRSLGLPVFEVPLAERAGNDDYDTAWAGALDQARSRLGPVEHVAYGDLFLDDVRGFREQQGRRLAFTPLFPLWGAATAPLAREFIAAGYEAYVTCVDTTQLDGAFAGRRFDLSFLGDLPETVDPCGERGEFHTCVVSGPLFSEAIPVRSGARVRREARFEYVDLVPRVGMTEITSPKLSPVSRVPGWTQ